MRFRPCIDIHDGKVKQIVGETLDDHKEVIENFVSTYSPSYYANLFKKNNLTGGHVIMLGKGNVDAALEALEAYPGGLHIGGGINADNALLFLNNGASHVIITSYIFPNGRFSLENLKHIVSLVGKEKLVIDLSCKEKNGKWLVAINKWKTTTDFELNSSNLKLLQSYCDELLIHAVDVEGKQSGFSEELVTHIAKNALIPITYAGGIRSIEDLENFYRISQGKIDFTIGSALDIFGGKLKFNDVLNFVAR
ncbi:phosphoribosylformimino-5-aminoimidazole carboxamide ribotide isomerase [Chengkuizengella axinellae]|uniref:Phosphoribosylformimino-5-aminoimidazole carboxamide ribotide isomerase n=1 Tax=Chengkuizengella axinellae TaxID=3064388 RepID=A0ABT9IUZ5_9BACL|nr:phosphoribosylformimino-5-aminoimidazole carboxamide ribotide isomerase [Chengkuizengella sp. 2205SS18-9]MDP5272684.1 phosphoribosylformimino-5-aminoimidazole carboxamide ribotide isomerase [Chengkuizengella sp. 2205SS18-9]